MKRPKKKLIIEKVIPPLCTKNMRKGLLLPEFPKEGKPYGINKGGFGFLIFKGTDNLRHFYFFRSGSNSEEDNIVQIGNCDINGSNNLILNWGEGFTVHRHDDEGLGSFTGERRRRKLPEIPTSKKRKEKFYTLNRNN